MTDIDIPRDAFAPVSLRGKLGPKPVYPTVEAVDATPSVFDDAPKVADDPAVVGDVELTRAPHTEHEHASGARVGIPVGLPSDVADPIIAIKNAEGLSWAGVLVRAFSNVSDASLRSYFGVEASTRMPGAVERKARATTRVRPEFRLTVAQVDWLDDTALRVGAVRPSGTPNRSALITAVLALYGQGLMVDARSTTRP